MKTFFKFCFTVFIIPTLVLIFIKGIETLMILMWDSKMEWDGNATICIWIFASLIAIGFWVTYSNLSKK